MLKSKKKNLPQNSILYSVETGTSVDGETGEFRNPKFLTSYLTSPSPDINTVKDCYLKSMSQFSAKPCLGTRFENAYIWKSFEDVYLLAQDFGSGLINKNLCPEELHDGYRVKFLAIYSKNCEFWHITDIASTLYGLCTVPLYDNLNPSSFEFILAQTSLRTIILSRDKLQNIVDLKTHAKTGSIENLVVFEEVSDNIRTNLTALGFNVFSFSEILNLGHMNKRAFADYSPDSIYTISYTSGTTGNPKGVVMTHTNALSVVASVMEVYSPDSSDTHLSYLPLAHIYERIFSIIMMYGGARIGYYSGDVLKITDDLAILKPTILLSVPRLLTRFYDKIKAFIASQSPLKARFINKAIKIKLAQTSSNPVFTHTFYDSLIFNKIRNLLGGRVKLITTGSAAISPEILNFLKICFCCQIIEGYGQTENGGVICTCYYNENEVGLVGGPVGCVSLKLVDVPEMNYFTGHSDKPCCGEICYRGPCVMPQYFKDPASTHETIDRQGWVHSGDIGLIRHNGGIQLIDRKKNIFKLAQGEFITPEKIENIYSMSKYVALIFLYGDSLRNYCIAIIVPEKEELEKLSEKLGVSGDYEYLCRNANVNKFLIQELERIGKENGLSSLEQAKKIYLYPGTVSIESGLLTPTYKIKRFDMRKFFESKINFLYSH